jgi:HEAT repeat protein
VVRSGDQGASAQAADFLALFLRAQPALAFEVMALLQRGQVPADLESTLFFALELAGTQEAHDALVQGLSDQHAARNRARAAAALPDVPNPSQGTLAALANTAREARAETKDETQLVRNSATYALGALEQRTRGKNPELAKQTLTEIRGQLETVHSPNELAAALDAIGNSGNSAFIADLKPHLDADNALVRAHAIEAMGHMDPEANKSVFRDLIVDEQDPRIRGTIARTCADQARRADSLAPTEVVRGALDVLAREPDPRVRGLLIDLVGPSCASDPHTMQALAEQFKRENEPLLLRQIGRYVPADKLGS